MKTDDALSALIRKDEKGRIDDVAIQGNLFRMERMDKNLWWLCIYQGDKKTTFNFTATRGLIDVELIEDEIGCRDDSHPPIPLA